MAGVRIQHPTARSSTFTLVDSRRPYRKVLACQAQIVVNGELRPCARTHAFKTYHLLLDEAGAAIVSPEIWERIGPRLVGGGFRVANEVASPPAQTLVLPRLILQTRSLAPGDLDAKARTV